MYVQQCTPQRHTGRLWASIQVNGWLSTTSRVLKCPGFFQIPSACAYWVNTDSSFPPPQWSRCSLQLEIPRETETPKAARKSCCMDMIQEIGDYGSPLWVIIWIILWNPYINTAYTAEGHRPLKNRADSPIGNQILATVAIDITGPSLHFKVPSRLLAVYLTFSRRSFDAEVIRIKDRCTDARRNRPKRVNAIALQLVVCFPPMFAE